MPLVCDCAAVRQRRVRYKRLDLWRPGGEGEMRRDETVTRDEKRMKRRRRKFISRPEQLIRLPLTSQGDSLHPPASRTASQPGSRLPAHRTGPLEVIVDRAQTQI